MAGLADCVISAWLDQRLTLDARFCSNFHFHEPTGGQARCLACMTLTTEFEFIPEPALESSRGQFERHKEFNMSHVARWLDLIW